MVVIKYNLLAAYTKRLFALFAASGDNLINDPGHKDVLNLDCLSQKRLIVNQLRLINLAVDGAYDKSKFVYFGVEDVPVLWNDPLKILDKLDDKVVVLFPLIPAEERIESLVMRINSASAQCGADLDCYLQNFFRLHLGENSICGNYDVSHITFESVILMRDFERLARLHGSGDIELVVVSKETILNDPKRMFDKLGLHYSEADPRTDGLKTKRMPKTACVDRQRCLKEILERHAPAITTRYVEIHDAMQRHGVELL